MPILYNVVHNPGEKGSISNGAEGLPIEDGRSDTENRQTRYGSEDNHEGYFEVLGIGAGAVGSFYLEIENYLNRKTTESYWVCRFYRNPDYTGLILTREVGPFTGTRPDF